MIRLKRTLLGAALAVALVGGGSIAFAETQQTPPQNRMQAFLDDVASHLGVQPAALQSAIQAAEIDQLNQAVASGKLSQQRADAIKQRIESGKGGFFPIGKFGAHRRGPRGMGMGLGPAAQFLGLTPQQLQQELRSGKSLAQVATDRGKSVQDLEQALLAPIKARLDKAVSSGKMTADQEQAALAKAQQRIDKMVNQVWKWPGQRQGQPQQQQPNT